MGRWRSNETTRPAARSLRARLNLEALEERTLLSAGSLDTSFGIGGMVLTDGIGEAFAAALQSNGDIVAAGGLSGSIVVARYNPGGSADATFGSNGVVSTSLGTGMDQAEGVAIQPDGKIVVAGFTQGATTGLDFAVLRYNSNGTLDTTFGKGGIVTTDFDGLDDQAADVVLQSDGKIVVGGTATISANTTDFAVVRYNTDGSLDTSFGTGGKVTTFVGQFPTAERLALQSDGKIILVGGSGFELVRYNPNGTLDTSFGTGGIVSVLPDSIAEDVAIRTNGSIVVGGTLTNGTSNTDFQIAQFLPNGTLDSSFGSGGITTTAFNGADATAFALTMQSDGSVVLAGSISNDNTLADEWALTRYTATGSLDFSFGLNGKVLTNMGSDIEEIHSLLLPAQGQLLAVGLNDSGFALARYLVPPPQPIDTSANALFVDQLFLQLLGRPADDAGRNYFTALLDQGNDNRFLTPAQQQQVARMQVVQLIQSSVEYRTEEVQNLYQSILDRPADTAGLNAWVAFLGNGGTEQQVEEEIMGSAEFVGLNGGTASSFVTAVYNELLGRDPDPAGGAAWVNLLNGGASTESVVTGVLLSAESATLTTDDFFADFLSRQPDTVGQSYYVNALMSGVSNEYLIMFIVSSQEFYNDAQAM